MRAPRWRALGHGLTALLALALLTVAAWTTSGDTPRWDWGASGSASLGEASQRLAARLEGPVHITAALPEGHLLRRHVQRLVAAYRERHAPFELTFVDPEAQAERARELGLVRTGEALVRHGDRAERVSAPSEARLSAALERLLRRGERFIAYLTGHGERDLLGDTNYDLGGFGRALERKGYRLQPLELAAARAVPDNAALLIVAAPQDPLAASERRALRAHVEQGGNLLWLGEPGGASPLPGVPAAIGTEAVTDPDAGTRLGVDDPRFLLLETLAPHPVTETLDAPLLLVGAGGVTSGPAQGWRIHPLLPRPARFTGGDTGSPFALALQGPGGARAAVVGDADLLANTYLGNGANLPFGLQLVDWLNGAEGYVGTYVEPAADQRLSITRAGAGWLAAALLAGLPGLLVIVAAWRWRRLRRE